MHFTQAKGILSSHNSMNMYRGCTHGCIYCDSRSKCYNFTHDFEDIEVKINAPQLLEKALITKRNKCMIGTGAMCDPYLHHEKDLMITRKCLEIIDHFGFGVAIQTKSDMILRDIDLLASINEKVKCVVQMTLTTYDEKLCKILEPNVCTTKKRYEVLKVLQENKIPTVVWMTPILPYINDNESNIRGVLEYCFDADVKGIINFNMGTTMREGDREYFYKALDDNFPGIKQKYIKRYGYSYECISDNNDYLMEIFRNECESHNVMHNLSLIFSYMNEIPTKNKQISFFQ
ncbi:MAG: radical SAM protein [Clostridiaceae bacterium]|nr:radical SAM protein [Clostridiaceae bacterium]